MGTIGDQTKVIFGTNVVVKVGTDTLGVADRFRARWGYPTVKRPIFGTNIPLRVVGSFVGELVVEGLWSTDNVLDVQAKLTGGTLPSVTVTIEETDTQGTPTKKTWTFVGQMTPFEHEGQADQFSGFRFTLDLTAEPAVA